MHMQNACTIFAQTHVEKHVPTHTFAHIWYICFLLFFTLCFLWHSCAQQKTRQKAIPTNTAKGISADKETGTTFFLCNGFRSHSTVQSLNQWKKNVRIFIYLVLQVIHVSKCLEGENTLLLEFQFEMKCFDVPNMNSACKWT